MGIQKTSLHELKSLLSSLGVGEGKTIMVQSAVFTLGVIETGLTGLYRVFRELLGESGTLIVPTFTYSFRRNEIYDVRFSKSPKEIGAFSEYVRTLPNAVRSVDPLFSMAGVGPDAVKLLDRTSHNCFGMGSIYDNLFAANTLFVGLGVTYSTGLPCFMHLERLAKVDYRCEMRVEGRSIGYDGNVYDDWAIHFARDEARYPLRHTNREPLGSQLEELNISTAVDFGSGHHMAFKAEPFAEFVLSQLAQNPHVMLAED